MICVVSGHHGEADVAHEYAKSEMRLLSSLEGLSTVFVPFFIPILVGKSGILLITEGDSVLQENLNEVEKLAFDFRPCRDCVLVKMVRDGGLLHNLGDFRDSPLRSGLSNHGAVGIRARYGHFWNAGGAVCVDSRDELGAERGKGGGESELGLVKTLYC